MSSVKKISEIVENDLCIEIYDDGDCLVTVERTGYFQLTSKMLDKLVSYRKKIGSTTTDLAASKKPAEQKIEPEVQAVIVTTPIKPTPKPAPVVIAISDPVIKEPSVQDVVKVKKPLNSIEPVKQSCIQPKKKGGWTLTYRDSRGRFRSQTFPTRKLFRAAQQELRQKQKEIPRIEF